MASKGTKRCCIVTSVVILLLFVVLLILCFTVFKPENPRIEATPVRIEHIKFTLVPKATLVLTLGVDIHIGNPNYARFKYENSNISIYYGGEFVGEGPVAEGEIDARSSKTIMASVDVQAEKVVAGPHFLHDVTSGSLNFTSYSGMKGKVSILRIFKLHATTTVSCDIAVFLLTNGTTSVCESKVKI